MEKLKEYLAADPGDSFIRHALAMEYLSRGDYATARRLLEEVLALDPGAVGSYYQLAKLLQQAGETAEALRCYEKGMAAARAAGETRAFNELRTAYEDLADS